MWNKAILLIEINYSKTNSLQFVVETCSIDISICIHIHAITCLDYWYPLRLHGTVTFNAEWLFFYRSHGFDLMGFSFFKWRIKVLVVLDCRKHSHVDSSTTWCLRARNKIQNECIVYSSSIDLQIGFSYVRSIAFTSLILSLFAFSSLLQDAGFDTSRK